MLKEKEIVLGVTGGIAAYKAAELVRLMVKEGAHVHVVMTQNAQEFITPLTFQTLSGNPVATDPFALVGEQEIGHIALADLAELVVILPATANIIGKIANGIADDFLSTMVMATNAPVLFAPSMNVNMWENKALQKNIQILLERGYHLIEPGEGELACHWYGKGRLAELSDVVEKVEDFFSKKDLKGERFWSPPAHARTIGSCPIHQQSFLRKDGICLGQSGPTERAKVILITGPTSIPIPRGDLKVVSVKTAAEMRRAVLGHIEGCSVVIKAAAVSDFRPKAVSLQKMKKAEASTSLTLEKTDDILSEIGRKKRDGILLGFAAETENVVANAQKKLKEKNLDLIIVNDVTKPGAGFGQDTNQVKILFRSGEVKDLPLMSKEEVSQSILDEVGKLLKQKKGTRKK
jgi:phosphopantothenoylcysteine decarboxylase/phosphopantothenate--cysteine ligase